jgi:hypothetical protein
VARPKYIHWLTNEYTWALKPPVLLCPSLLCLISKRPHATVASTTAATGHCRSRRELAVVACAAAAPGHCCSCPELAAVTCTAAHALSWPSPPSPPALPAPCAPSPRPWACRRRPQPPVEGRPPSFFIFEVYLGI